MTKKIKISSVYFDTINPFQYEYRPISCAIEWFSSNSNNVLFNIINKADNKHAKIKLKGSREEINNLLCGFITTNGKWFNIG